MITRFLEKVLLEAINKSSTVGLLGPRQVGKTTLAIELAKTITTVYLDLENPLDLSKVADFPEFYAAHQHEMIILDEVQKKPGLFAEIRGIVDQKRRKGIKKALFLFLGSASPDLLRQSSESLAGRITYLELFPFNFLEIKSSADPLPEVLWLRGGFPESVLADSDKDSFSWRQNFIRTYLERDIPQLGPRIPAETLARFWTMLAYNQGSLFNASQLALSMGISSVTISRYLDLMVDLFLVRRLQPWFGNIKKRLVKSPKVYVRDSGLTHALLRIVHRDELFSHPVSGASWEGWVIENILSVSGQQPLPYFYRTSGGAEIDLILAWTPGDLWAIEIKKRSFPQVSKGFYSGCDDLKPSRKYVVYSGEDKFPLPGGAIALGLKDLMLEVVNYLK